MITVTGRTFDHRDLLKSMGGQWNNADRNWQFTSLRGDQIAALTAIPGVFVTAVATVPDRGNFWRSWGEAPPPTVRSPTQMFGDDQSFFNYFEDQDPTAFFGFSSVRAFADHVASLRRPDNDDPTRDNSAWRENEKRTTFTGTVSMAHALDLARNGWIDGMGITDKLTVDAAQSKRRYHDVAGGTVNVGRMLSGDPRHMVRRTRQPGHRNIRLFVSFGMWRGIGQAIATFRALVIAAMIDLLEREGYRCEVIAVSASRHLESLLPRDQFAIRVKAAHERLSLLDISFALGHPSFSRRLAFACSDVIPACNVEDMNSVVTEVFDDDDRPANEFFIPQLSPHAARQLTNDPMSILPFVEPKGLPIKIKAAP
jgi:hypothetical protein